MSEITVLDNDSITMKYYPDKKILHHTFHRYTYGEEFRDALNQGVDVFERYFASKWLSDDRKNSALPKEDQEWATNNWFRRVVKAGWKYWAIVLPKTVVGQMNMRLLSELCCSQGIETKLFDDPADAMNWLEKK